MTGRGRGTTFSSINTDALGIKPNLIEPGSYLDPPLNYPTLTTRPRLPLKLPEHDYMLVVMKDFVIQIRDSQFAISSNDNRSENKGILVGKYSDNLQKNKVEKTFVGIDWKRYPNELAPSTIKSKSSKRSNTSKINSKVKYRKVDRSVDPDQVLERLEKYEEGNESEEKSNIDSDKEDDVASNQNNFEEEEFIDMELDEGTDYANNYFDNGENYLDEDDDNFDEGGIF